MDFESTWSPSSEALAIASALADFSVPEGAVDDGALISFAIGSDGPERDQVLGGLTRSARARERLVEIRGRVKAMAAGDEEKAPVDELDRKIADALDERVATQIKEALGVWDACEASGVAGAAVQSTGVRSLIRAIREGWARAVSQPAYAAMRGVEAAQERELYPGVVASLVAELGAEGTLQGRISLREKQEGSLAANSGRPIAVLLADASGPGLPIARISISGSESGFSIPGFADATGFKPASDVSGALRLASDRLGESAMLIVAGVQGRLQSVGATEVPITINGRPEVMGGFLRLSLSLPGWARAEMRDSVIEFTVGLGAVERILARVFVASLDSDDFTLELPASGVRDGSTDTLAFLGARFVLP
ncbi:MAG TPA: hypothetical protein VKT78_01775 [Fimbriimonadaceae bacterium]|nr:hypothetical protein [Fimbriimonadaceae bacterium]